MEATTRTEATPVHPITDEPEQKTSTITKIALAILVVDVALFSFASTGLVVTVIVLEVCALGLYGLFEAAVAISEIELSSSDSDDDDWRPRSRPSYRYDNSVQSQAARAIRDIEDFQTNFRRELREQEIRHAQLAGSSIEDQRNTYQRTLNTIRESVEDMEKEPYEFRGFMASGVNSSIEMLESSHECFCTIYRSTFNSEEQLEELSRWLGGEIALLKERIS